MEVKRCKEEVRERGTRFPHYSQCERKAVKDGFCTQHHPDSVKARQAKADERYQTRIIAPIVQRERIAREHAEMRSLLEHIGAMLDRMDVSLPLGYGIPAEIRALLTKIKGGG